MSTLEVLKAFPSQHKDLLSSLGGIDPYYSILITFDLDQGEPWMPSYVAFQVLVIVWNLFIHRYIIDEGASTCVMSTFVWHNLGSPTLQPSTTALCAYDGCVSQPQGVIMNVPIELEGKTVLINIEVVNAQLEYNLLLGHNYMYTMQGIASTVF